MALYKARDLFMRSHTYDSASSTPLLSPFQLPVSLLLKKLCVSKYLREEAGQLFNTLQPPEDNASDIDGVVNHRDWITATLTQLSRDG